MVIGISGAGKTTLGERLARALDLPFVDLDDEHWGPGWAEPPEEVWHARTRELVAEPRWVLAGNYGGTIDIRARRADLVVLLEFHPAKCVWRLLLRSLKIRALRQTWRLPRECRAGPDWEPLRDYPEFLRYTWRFRRNSLPHAFDQLRGAGVERLVVLRNAREVAALVAALAEPGAREAIEARLEGLPSADAV
jgi:adenylate kinase family enzyme